MEDTGVDRRGERALKTRGLQHVTGLELHVSDATCPGLFSSQFDGTGSQIDSQYGVAPLSQAQGVLTCAAADVQDRVYDLSGFG